jgi:hypothetical protein
LCRWVPWYLPLSIRSAWVDRRNLDKHLLRSKTWNNRQSIFSLTAIPWYYNKINYFHV